MGPETNPVANQGTNFTLNYNVPFVREQLNKVAAKLIQLYQQAGQLDQANALRERLVKQFSVPPDVLSGQPIMEHRRCDLASLGVLRSANR